MPETADDTGKQDKPDGSQNDDGIMIKFTKMHGLGNDFVVIDAINQQIDLTPEKIHQWANRHYGIGFDQLLLVEPPASANADFKYRIFNADGGEVFQCGNGARCFARFVREKKLSDQSEIRVDTGSGQLLLLFEDDGLITVNMGVPRHAPDEIPILKEQEAKFYSVMVNQSEKAFGAVSMGNPHAVIQVNDIKTAPVGELGRELESHPIFPERANIGFMQVVDRRHIKLRVFERGAGETLACGSGACAAVVVGIEQNLLDHEVSVELPGGMLAIKWEGRGQPVYMTGSAITVFEGQLLPNDGATDVLTDSQIEHYLRQHPDFFSHHLGLLEQLSIPHPSGNAVSLLSKQLELVRSRHHEMEAQLNELVEIARENDASFSKMHKLILALLDAGSLPDLVRNLNIVFLEQFLMDFVALRIIMDKLGGDEADIFIAPGSEAIKPFSGAMASNIPVCGELTFEQAKTLFGNNALAVRSAAVIPMAFTQMEGLLVIGSRQANRFHPNMGTLFLTQIGELVATRLISLLQRKQCTTAPNN